MQHWALQQASAAALACPFCGALVRDRGALRLHIRDACTHLTHDFMQPDYVRAAPSATLDADERYAALHVVRLNLLAVVHVSQLRELAECSQTNPLKTLLINPKPLASHLVKPCLKSGPRQCSCP